MLRRALTPVAVLTAAALAAGLTSLSTAGAAGAAEVAPSAGMSWTAATVNGGGWVTGLVTGAEGQVYARTDVGGAYRWDETGQRWQQMLTASGVPGAATGTHGDDYSVESLVPAPSDGQVLYAAVGEDPSAASGRVLRSADGGRTWTDGGARLRIHGNGQWRWGGERLAVDPADPSVVLLGTRKDGVQRSTDGGRTFTRTSAPGGSSTAWEPAGVGFTLFDPASPVVEGRTQGAWAGVEGVGLLRTDDAGTSWRVLHAFAGVPRDVELGADGTLWAVVDGSAPHVLRVDRTGTATSIVPASGARPAMVAVDPADPRRVVVGDDGVRDGKLWRSLDGGRSWTALQIALAAPASSAWATGADIDSWMSGGALTFDPHRPGTLWFAEGMGVWRTTDLADDEVTWTFTSDGIEELVSNSAVKVPGQPLITASWDRGLFRHPTPETGGATLPYRRSFGSAWDVTASPTDPQFLVAVLDDHQDLSGRAYPHRRASAWSADGGATWTRFPALAAGTAPADLLLGNIAVSAGTSDNIVWVPSSGTAKAYYTRDRGATWSAGVLQGAVAGDYLHPAHYLKRDVLVADPAVPGTFLALGGNNSTGATHLWRTTDGGATWAKVVTSGLDRPGYWDFRYNSQLVAVRPGLLLAVTGQTDDGQRPYWRSTDGGRTWTVHTVLRNVHKVGVGAPLVPGGPATLWTWASSEGTHGLLRSADEGLTWTRVGGHPRDWYQSVTAVVGDPEDADRVYVGLIGGGFAVGRLGGALPLPSTAPTAPPSPTTEPTQEPSPTPTASPSPTVQKPGKGSPARKRVTAPVALSTVTTSTTRKVSRPRAAVRLTAAVTPAVAGLPVALQVREGSGWRTVRSLRTSPRGTVVATVAASRHRGTTVLRFVALHQRPALPTSPAIALQVR